MSSLPYSSCVFLITYLGTKPEDCLTAAARREIAWLSEHAKPQPRRTFLLHTDHEIDPREHISLLSKYLLVAPLLAPKEAELSAPTLRHPDLSLTNILLVPGSTRVLGFIDWQDAAILPLFMQAGYPAFCEHDMSRVQSLKKPKLPDDFNVMSAADKERAKIKFRLEEANLYYTAATGLENPKHLQALRLPNLGMRQYLITQTGFPWDADLINLRAALVGITNAWDDISTLPCPISFSSADLKKALNDASEWKESAEILSAVRDSLGIDSEGGTEPDNFEHAWDMNQKWRMEMLKHAEDHERDLCWRGWPYKNNDDSSLPPAP